MVTVQQGSLLLPYLLLSLLKLHAVQDPGLLESLSLGNLAGVAKVLQMIG